MLAATERHDETVADRGKDASPGARWPSGVGLYVMATILGTCLLSFAITHLLYFCAVGEEIGALVRAVSRIFRTFDHAKASISDGC
jgi:hypothetical protein